MNKRYVLFYDGKHLSWYDRLLMAVFPANCFKFSKEELLYW